MKSQVFLLFLFCISFNANAQLEFLDRIKSFNEKKSGFNHDDLKNTILLVEGFEAIGNKCKNKPILWESGLSLMPVYHCPNKDMTKRDKKDIEKFNKKIDKKIQTQNKLWNAYKHDYELVSTKDIESEKYSDKEKYRFVLKYYFAASYVGFANGNSNKDWSYRYFLYDRLKDKEYDTMKGRSTITNAKKLSNLSKVIKNLNGK